MKRKGDEEGKEKDGEEEKRSNPVRYSIRGDHLCFVAS